MTFSLPILSAGAITSVGLSLPSTAAAIRGAVDNFQETHFISPCSEPLMGAKVRLDSATDDIIRGGQDHLPKMFDLALEECLRDFPDLDLPSTALLLLFAEESRPIDTQLLEEDCLSRWRSRVGPIRLHTFSYRLGGVGCVPALLEARRLLSAGSVKQVILASVDSWLNTPSIQEGLSQERILHQDRSSGFIPGEAATAILLGGPSHSQAFGIRGLGTGEEGAPLFSDEPCYGKGLAQAMKQALTEAGLAAHDIHLRLADITGEEYFFLESTYAWSRLQRNPQPPGNDILMPTSRVGEIGAPAGLLMLAYVWHLFRQGRLPGPHTLLQLSSTQTLRGAIAVGAL